MPFNLSTSGDKPEHKLTQTRKQIVFNIELVTSDTLTQYVIEARLTHFLNNLGDTVQISVDERVESTHHLDNLDF